MSSPPIRDTSTRVIVRPSSSIGWRIVRQRRVRQPGLADVVEADDATSSGTRRPRAVEGLHRAQRGQVGRGEHRVDVRVLVQQRGHRGRAALDGEVALGDERARLGVRLAARSACR